MATVKFDTMSVGDSVEFIRQPMVGAPIYGDVVRLTPTEIEYSDGYRKATIRRMSPVLVKRARNSNGKFHWTFE